MADGRTFPANIEKTSRTHDLALLKIGANELPKAKWFDGEGISIGMLVAAVLPNGTQRVGVISQNERSIPAVAGQILGLQDSSEGLQVVDDESMLRLRLPLRKGDIIVSIEDRPTPDMKALTALLGVWDKRGTLDLDPGDPISVAVQRDSNRVNVRFPLPLGAFLELAGSKRRTGFPSVFDTDALLEPTECGGPLVDVSGRVLGITIACRRRGQTHVVPATVVAKFLE